MASELSIRAGDVELQGTLSMPPDASGLVVFAYSSGSARLSARNRRVARALEARGLATLLFDLLTLDEELADAIDARFRFDIPMLAARLVAVLDWAERDPSTRGLPIGCFGANTSAAAVLIAAAERPNIVRAVVSQGGRPNLASAHLERVKAPTLLLIGGADHEVLTLNQDAQARMRVACEISVVPGATHLFEEPGALEEVARQAGHFLLDHVASDRRHPLRQDTSA